jgi:hypothetical protein
MSSHASAKRESLSGEADKAEIQAVEHAISKLVLAVKKTNMYPENHSVSQEAIQELARSLDAFTEHFGDLVLEVLEKGFRYKDCSVETVAGSGDVAYRCYRDGVEWLTFAQGLGRGELKTFVDILNAHRIIGDEDEGDIVTSLWEAGLTHVHYYTGNAVWRDEPVLDLTRFRVMGRPEREGASSRERGSVPEARSVLERTREKYLWQLTREEMERTRRMVQEEESRDFTRDIFDVLLVVLEQQRNEEDVTNALDIIRESLEKALSKGHFRSTCRFLEHFHHIREEYAQEGQWVLAHLDDFLVAISGSRVLSSLHGYTARHQGEDPDQLEYMKRTLVQLLPESVEALGGILSDVSSRDLGSALRSAMRDLAEKDVRPLARLARSADPGTAKQAIAVLSRVSDERVPPCLLEATRSNDASVRRAAVKALTRRGMTDYHEFLSLLADPDAEVRRLVFDFFSKSRDPKTETRIAEYIRQRDFSQKDARFLLTLYRLLGWCGSLRSKEFLRERLLSDPVRMWGVRAVHRRGAAMALTLFQEGEAEHLLRKASSSLWPSRRSAVRKARKQEYAA